ncbi:epoxide hydrolase family protein [Streptomyces sp. NBC_01304]|uniref:epoxide hydrolase family protein n=1 Tax=Streptomyces sp. NBC_01304 TaxID=2903818 RepID=UPI002E0FC2C6|nr:epoxide hydrolase [Streptomyces sp. NBC_01304]
MSTVAPPETTVQPFRIEVPQADLDDLQDRLARTRWSAALSGAGWERGVPVDYLKELAEHWRVSFNWRQHEAQLNELPQFTTVIDGATLHLAHIRSRHEQARPLLLLHGWPGSMVEFLDLVGPLTDPTAHGGEAHDAFHLVIPSLPGFGFSGPLPETGWTDGRVAAALAELMTRLGYDQYGVHGGDVGAFIAPLIGRCAPERVLGVHVNNLVTFPTGDPADLAALSHSDKARLKEMKRWQEELGGYMQLQGTRPQTIAAALNDSPAGQLAWIAEKFKDWTDPASALPHDAVDLERLLANVSIYWFTDTATSVANSYYERFNDPAMWTPKPRGTVPTGVAVFTTDTSIRRFADTAHNVVHWSEFDRGGHFPALEAPDLLIADLKAFFRAVA